MAYHVTEKRADEIRRLRARGLSYQAIAAKTGIHRDTVGAIVRGEWNPVDRRNFSRRNAACLDFVDPPVRCTCGARINQFPCVACRTRRTIGLRADDGPDMTASSQRQASREFQGAICG